MTDLPLYLPEDVYLKSLVISADFNIRSSLIQRAIVLLTLSDNDDFKVNGISVLELFRMSTTAAIESILLALSSVADNIKYYLNNSDDPSVEANPVDSVAFSAEEEDSTIAVKLSITRADETEEETTVYSYE